MSQPVDVVEAGAASIPAIGLGTWQAPGPDCQAAVRHALQVGYRHVDTAQLYGNEAFVGQGMKESGVPREEVFLTTKVRVDLLAPRQATAAIEGSLSRLDAGWIDLLLIHWPSRDVPVEATLDAMRLFCEDGRVRHLGVSNFTVAQLDTACAHTELVCNQVEYHPFLSQRPVLEACRRHGLALAAYCPLARGRVIDDPVLLEIAAAHGRSAAQVALRWLIQQEGVVALPKSVTPSRIEENLAVGDFELSDEQMARIRGLARGQRLISPPFAPGWDPQ